VEPVKEQIIEVLGPEGEDMLDEDEMENQAQMAFYNSMY
jgi:hypothetical protein